MKKIALVAAVSLTGSAALAGNPAPAEVPVVEVVQDTASSSSSGALLPILALVLIGAVIASNN